MYKSNEIIFFQANDFCFSIFYFSYFFHRNDGMGIFLFGAFEKTFNFFEVDDFMIRKCPTDML